MGRSRGSTVFYPTKRGRLIPAQSSMTSFSLRHSSRPWLRSAAGLLVLAVMAMLWTSGGPADAQGTSSTLPPASGGAATGKVGIHLVRLLSEVPEETEKKIGPLHDLRVELVPGNVLVFRKGSEFAALLPIDKLEGRVDSLRYFYYVEKSPLFWFIGGERSKGIRVVADGSGFQFDTFRLIWKNGGDEAGWIDFPDAAENQGLRFSVVSGQSVDKVDPKETKYWVELGAEGKAGF